MLGVNGATFWAKTKVNYDCSDGAQLTMAEIEGRRQMRAMMDVVRKYVDGGGDIALLALGSCIGIRETRQIKCEYQLTFEDIVSGRRFGDAVVNSCYPPDIHHKDEPGATYYYLDGVSVKSSYLEPEPVERRWKESEKNPPEFWQAPYRCLVPVLPITKGNVLVCGRAVDADKAAFGAIRVMINMNQTGEAAGAAAYLAISSGKNAKEINADVLRATMKKSGSIII
jgi:hypothetical protein